MSAARKSACTKRVFRRKSSGPQPAAGQPWGCVDGKTIEKPDDDHREGKLESFTTAFYLHPCKTPFGETHRQWR
jgi:hypothetical protein